MVNYRSLDGRATLNDVADQRLKRAFFAEADARPSDVGTMPAVNARKDFAADGRI
jgi:hypothetical protein